MLLQISDLGRNNPPAANPGHVPTEDELAESIHLKLSTGTAQYIAAGLECLEAKNRLKGRFTAFVETKLGWSLDTIEKWIQIARTFPDSATWRNLPSNWTTLYVLTRLPKKARAAWIADGTVHPLLTHKAAEALVRRAKQSNSNRSGEESVSTEERDDNDARPDNRDVSADERSGREDASAAEPATTAESSITQNVAVQDDIGSSSLGELARLQARLEELERERRQWEIQRCGYESEVEELRAKLDETSIRHQRRLFRQALQAMEKSERANLPAKQKRSFHNSAIIDLTEFVRSAARDELSLARFDVYCRAERH